MSRERILYPCYFDASLQRKEGRRVKRSLAVKNPELKDIEQALKKAGLEYHTEQKPHPSRWIEREGRVAVVWEESKELLIRQVAGQLKGRK